MKVCDSVCSIVLSKDKNTSLFLSKDKITNGVEEKRFSCVQGMWDVWRQRLF